MPTIVLAEDDAAIAEPLANSLRREGYEVVPTTEGEQTLQAATRDGVDLLVLDLGLPGMDGLEVCRRLRTQRPKLGVLMLTARADEVDFVVGLDAGADDYVSKPFRLAELMARVRALLRRRNPDVLEGGGVRLEAAGRRVSVDGAEITLANKEFELLRVLMEHPGEVVSREQILVEVWQDPELKTSKTLDMHVSWLRRKLSGAANGQPISTVRGMGFRFNE